MKSRVVFFYIMIVFFLYNGCDYSRQYVREDLQLAKLGRIAIFPLSNLSDYPRAGEILTELMYTEILSAGGFDVIPYDELKHKLGVKPDMDVYDIISERTIKETASLAGADTILTGDVTEFRYKEGVRKKPVVGINIKIICPKTSRVVWAYSLTKEDLGFAFYQGSLSLTSQKVCRSAVSQLIKESKR